MEPTPDQPSNRVLWVQACALVKEAGPAFAATIKRSRLHSPVATAVLASGQLGTQAPEQAIIQALKGYPLLWGPVNRTDERKAQMQQFLSEVRQALEEAGPKVLAGLGKGLAVAAGKSKSTATTNAQAVERAAQQLSERHKRLLTMIRDEPAKAVMSARTRLNQDVVQWENTLIFLSLSAPTPSVAQLMVATGELIRQGLLDQVFTEADLAAVAAMAPGVWLRGQNDDLTALRLRAADRLGMILDDPERAPAAMAVLSGMKTKAKGGLPQPVAWSDEQLAQAQAVAQNTVERWVKQLEDHLHSDEGMGPILVEHFRHAQWADTLSRQDWQAIARAIPEGYDPHQASEQQQAVVDGAILQRLVPRTEDLILSQVSTATMNQSQEPEADNTTPFFGRPRA